MPLYLRTLGDLALFETRDSRVPLVMGVKPLLIPAFLATQPRFERERDYLASLIWPQAAPERARSSLRQALYHLQKYGQGAGIEGRDSSVHLDPNALSVDLWEFERAVQQDRYEDVVQLGVGGFLQGGERSSSRELTQWVEAQDTRISTAVSAAYSQLVRQRLEEGAVQEALRFAQAFARANPLSERAQLTLIRTLRSLGEDLEALRTYEAYRSLVMSELETDLPEEMETALERLRDEVIREPDERSVVYVTAPVLETRSPPSALKRAAWTLAGAVAAFGAMGIAWLAASAGAEPPPSVVVGALMADGSIADVVVGPGGVEILPESPTPSGPPTGASFVNSDRTMRVEAIPGRGGRDLLLDDLVTGEQRVLVSTSGDEVPLSWSPDGRQILYKSGEMAPNGRSFRDALMIVDVATGERHAVGDLWFDSNTVDGIWSPLGTDLALTVGSSFVQTNGRGRGVYFVRPDGTDLRYIASSHPIIRDPTWSPDGQRIVFTGGEPEAQDLFLVAAAGTEIQPLTVTPGSERAPIWIGDNLLAYFAWRDDAEAELRMLELDTGESWPVEAPARLSGFRSQEIVWAGDPWLDTLLVTPGPAGSVSPGQLLFLDMAALTGEGEVVPWDDLPLTWGSSDTSVVRPLAPGWFRVDGTGEADLSVLLAGWRSVVTPVRSVELARADLDLLFEEDWTQGLRDTVWTLYGSPAPTVDPSGGVAGSGSLKNNGDADWGSGAVSVSGFPIGDGLTLEVWGRAPFTDQHWQDLHIGFDINTPPRDSVVSAWLTQRSAPYITVSEFKGGIVGEYPRPVGWAPPVPDNPGEWHCYTIQITPGGQFTLVIDGVVSWRGILPEPLDPDAPLHVTLAGASVNTDIRHGPVRVWRGERYVVR